MKMTTRTIPILAERKAIAKLALGDMDAFVARAAADVGFPFESEALDALARLIEPYERLRARLKAETGVRRAETAHNRLAVACPHRRCSSIQPQGSVIAG
jgi:hypothetical protein